MTESGTTTSEAEASDGFWGTVGWSYPGLGLGALIGPAFAGPSAINVWEPWEHLGRMTFGFGALFAIGGGAIALCVGWAIEAWKKRRAGGSESPQSTTTSSPDTEAKVAESDQTEEAVDPAAARLGRLSNARVALWVLLGILCCAMAMLGEISRHQSNRLPIGTKTGDAVSPEVWTAVMIAVALMVAALVVLCLAEDRVRRTTQRDWLRAQLREPMPPAKRTRQFYRCRSTPHASRACALLAAPFVCAGLAVLVVGSVEMGEEYAGSTAAYADFRMWGIAAVFLGVVLLALGAVRAARWHRENSDLRADILERWPFKPASQRAEDAG